MPWSFLHPRRGQPPLVPVLLPEPLGSEVDALVGRDQEVAAVRLVRERTGLGLLVAVKAVDHRSGRA